MHSSPELNTSDTIRRFEPLMRGWPSPYTAYKNDHKTRFGLSDNVACCELVPLSNPLTKLTHVVVTKKWLCCVIRPKKDLPTFTFDPCTDNDAVLGDNVIAVAQVDLERQQTVTRNCKRTPDNSLFS